MLDEVDEEDPDEIHSDPHEHHDEVNVRALAADDTQAARPSTSEARASIFGDPDGKIVINLPPSIIETTSTTAKKEEILVEAVSTTTATTTTTTESNTTIDVATGEPAALPTNEALLDSTA
jgi:hypothetical protein